MSGVEAGVPAIAAVALGSDRMEAAL